MAATLTVEQTPFSTMLRESTRDVHERAHRSAFMDALFDGRLPLRAYARLAAQYHFIYQAIEEASDALACHPVGGAFVFDELRRGPALAADLAFLVGEDWAERVTPVPATEDYVRRIRTVAADWPGGYVAHHYTRYLGDLAGGQAVRGLLKRTYGVEGPGALFYHFDLGNVPAFRKRYRALLDEAPWDEAERRRIVTETLVAFELNVALLADLADEVPG
ncbi:biliverdin-producing heme oxygenase [Amycolatopsis acidiphila]|uniref:Biliverdin-producing heme oxygenase n=1 Tax=Amycolatopsis acidiphila TaxID=715473 RepID=A0A558AJR9_9PSEU|nr:biliverdin-producing heme oxygenase [Amycolatopsis acidiphila]TVT24500.1 biliverdin-producing heme oxygenase [Amycolatopsis acidiphila]UIJ59289.1 biliverdin-producing heme oxygenase [Amycolatopsis acidiphila]GHG79528.1 biliverdin-producing heme oxygenase [Amycolatopsis acidiphila]